MGGIAHFSQTRIPTAPRLDAGITAARPESRGFMRAYHLPRRGLPVETRAQGLTSRWSGGVRGEGGARAAGNLRWRPDQW